MKTCSNYASHKYSGCARERTRTRSLMKTKQFYQLVEEEVVGGLSGIEYTYSSDGGIASSNSL
ncbi:uncharacterized protein PHALS_07158 [Plasmopara halstedii]|uniref:Uncharacterized protein n=1 Tax=Plasmopara halstedii TaxID=4781 RepID=A0A0P1B3Q7_PLAHL|nr:uncharacterized protein PHALS_07158 [Plasmopara halstedii]CEG49393.1 hypothetical protein PHALS_07158 [Plasmopara halstedii]|eukprot:XP_024585762.1 hypothetical protein PHALS_07158 [Plasmopara halstedii]